MSQVFWIRVQGGVVSMNWSQLRKQLQEGSPERLIELLKGLYDLSPANKAFLRQQFSETPQDTEFLEKCRQQVIQAIYPPQRQYPDYPKFSQARKAINEYKKATNDINGIVDPLLTYVERGTAFTGDFGDIDEPFYERLETALSNAADLITASPTRIQLYQNFRPRFLHLRKDAGWMGWGYGDAVKEIVAELEAL
ncbi:MAG: hypothetical protein AB1649_24705 [Chloroflexota bacterium]